MSSCNEYAEFACHLTLATGAPPHLVLPIARRLRRLATTHQRRCETQCNGCWQCRGTGYVRPINPIVTNPPSVGAKYVKGCEEGEPNARPCPTCSTDTTEAAIEATVAELEKLRIDNIRHARPGEPHAPIGGPLRAIFQHDPRGATVRLKLPTHREGDYGLAVPTSTR